MLLPGTESFHGAQGNPPGKIPGGATLVFVMEMVTINGGKKPAKRCDPTDAELANCDEQEKKYLLALPLDSRRCVHPVVVDDNDSCPAAR